LEQPGLLLSRSQIKHDSQRIAQVSAVLQTHMLRYGYDPVETPIIDSADLFLTKAGDQIISRLFTFERHGQPLALRPEFTAPAAYRYITMHSTETPIARWQFSGPIFEDDPTDLTRHYQRYSVGAELIGMAGPAAEAEIISMATQGIRLQNISNWQLVIGHVGLMRRLLAVFDLDERVERFLLNNRAALRHPQGKENVLKRLEKYLVGNLTTADSEIRLDFTDNDQTLGGRSQQDILRRLNEKRKRAMGGEQIVAALDFLEHWGAINGPPEAAFGIIEQFIAADNNDANSILATWQQVMTLLEVYDISSERIIVQPDLARNWDYYTGIVFELRTEDGLDMGGGGRYDDLTRLIGGQNEIPAVGFAYYIDQLLEAGPPVSAAPQRVVSIVTSNAQHGAQWAHALRSRQLTAVIMPEETVTDSGLVMRIDDDGCVRVSQKTYTLAQIDRLIVDPELFS
jgi:histidyl-tRNA synthetase